MKKNLISRLMKPRLLSRIRNKIRSLFFLDQWMLLVAKNTGHETLSWDGFTSLVPPTDRFWADPFVWLQDGKFYLFIEELFYSTGRGTINCLTLNENLEVITNQVVLEKPYHLSYPFIFQYNGQTYMLPETKHNNQIELYRCEHFPDQWILEKVLIKNIRALDSTLLQFNGKWWLFTNVQEEGGSGWDTLYLYYSDSPLSEQWTPHPRNPIVKDIYSARPAGRIFQHNGKLIRPSQDCSVDYGYAMNFNCITSLNETDYTETREFAFKPPNKGKILATHTFNSMDGLTAIDAIQLRRRF